MDTFVRNENDSPSVLHSPGAVNGDELATLPSPIAPGSQRCGEEQSRNCDFGSENVQ